MAKLRGVCIGSGYFSAFHYDAWSRIPDVEIVAFSTLDRSTIEKVKSEYHIPSFYEDYREMLEKERPDFVDIITPPETHEEMCRFAASLGVDMICQKPLTPSYATSEQLVNQIECKARLIVHENFRFQPWHRQIKTLLSDGTIGRLHQLYFHSRMGDGWGPDAYLSRQPYFREYERLLIYETGVHFIDVFRYHAGEVESAYALLKRLNPVIKGEDSGLMILEMRDGATAIWDANRYNESNHPKKRFTFGAYTVEGENGTIRLYSDGRITVQLLGEPEQDHSYELTDRGFAGDCCFQFQKHAVHALTTGTQAETEGIVYLNNLRVQEAVYESAAKKTRVKL